MTFTVTFDASHKVKQRGAQVRGLFQHICRNADNAAGFAINHANKNIDPARTALNESMVNDGTGGFREPVSVNGRPPSHELEHYLEQRLSTVTRALRKDAVVMRGIILQLDPKWFAEHDPHWRSNGLSNESNEFTDATLEWAIGEFGQENIVGFSLHLDEVNPQLQLLITPVTSDGRLSQKDFFAGPADFRRQHKALRAHMEAAGFDVEHRVTERSREHLSSSEFQQRADRLAAAVEDTELEREAYENMRAGLEKRSANLDLQSKELQARAKRLAAEKVAVDSAMRSAREAESSARSAEAIARRAHDESEAERAKLRRALEVVEATPPDFDRWLDRAKVGGKTLRMLFDADMVRLRAPRNDIRQMLDSPDTPEQKSHPDRELGS